MAIIALREILLTAFVSTSTHRSNSNFNTNGHIWNRAGQRTLTSPLPSMPSTSLMATSEPSPAADAAATGSTQKVETQDDAPVDNMIERYQELAHKLEQLYDAKFGSSTTTDDDAPQQLWIGIAGGPGSGKSTSAERVTEILNTHSDIAVVLPVDGYHTPRAQLQDALLRRGAPWTFDVAMCAEDLRRAKRDGKASLPIYDRDISDPRRDGVQLERHHKFVLVEGLYLLFRDDDDPARAHRQDHGNGWAELYDLWDERWFIRAPSREVQYSRLINRSLKTWTDAKAEVWGTGEEGATKRVQFNDAKNMDLIAPHEQYADEVIVTM